MPKRNRNKPLVDLDNPEVRKFLYENGWFRAEDEAIKNKQTSPWDLGMIEPKYAGAVYYNHPDPNIRSSPEGRRAADRAYREAIRRPWENQPIVQQDPGQVGTEVHREIERLVNENANVPRTHISRQAEMQMVDEIAHGRPIHTVPLQMITPSMEQAHMEYRARREMGAIAGQPQVQMDPRTQVHLDTVDRED